MTTKPSKSRYFKIPWPHVSPDTSYYAGTYLDDTTSYLNTLNNSTPSYMNSPTLSHVTTEPAPFVTDPFSSCAKSGMGSPASYYSKTLGPCTEVIKASMDLIWGETWVPNTGLVLERREENESAVFWVQLCSGVRQILKICRSSGDRQDFFRVQLLFSILWDYFSIFKVTVFDIWYLFWCYCD